MRAMSLLLVLAVMPLSGCSLFGKIDDIPDDKLASYLKLGAEKATQYGLKLALKKEPDKAEAITKSAVLGAKIVRENILPALSGVDSNEVAVSAVDTALAELTGKLSPQVIAVVQLAINILSTQVALPTNPAEKLSPRTQMALVGFFDGLANGLDSVTRAIATRDIGPPKLTWPKQ